MLAIYAGFDPVLWVLWLILIAS